MRQCPACDAPLVVSRFNRRNRGAVLACTRSGCGWHHEISRSVHNYPAPPRPAARSAFFDQLAQKSELLKEELKGSSHKDQLFMKGD